MGKKGAILLCCLFIFFLESDSISEVSAPEIKAWTILYYYNADHTLWRKFYQIIEQLTHVVVDDDINVIVQQDGPLPGDGKRWQLKQSAKRKNLEVVYRQGVEYDMGRETTLASFVKWALDNFPAKRTILVVNGHGAGIVSFGTVGSFLKNPGRALASSRDDSSGTYFSEKKLKKELKQVLGDKKLDLFVYNSCYMGGIEVMHELSQFAEFAVASEDHIILAQENMVDGKEVKRGAGIPAFLLPAFIDNNRQANTRKVAKYLIKEFEDFYNHLPHGVEQTQYTLAAYDLSRISEVSSLYNKMIAEFNQLSSMDPTYYSYFYRECLSLSKLQVIGYLDLGLVAKAVYNSSRLASAANLIRYLYSDTFIIDKSIINSEYNLAGLSIFVPYDFYFYLDNNLNKGLAEYFTIGWVSDSHRAFITNYLQHIRKHKEAILVEMIRNYLTRGVMEVSRFKDSETNLFYLFRTLEGLVAVYPEAMKKRFSKEYLKVIKDSSNNGAYFKKHKKYIAGMADEGSP